MREPLVVVGPLARACTSVEAVVKHEWIGRPGKMRCRRCGVRRGMTPSGKVFYFMPLAWVAKRAGRCRPPVSAPHEKVEP